MKKVSICDDHTIVREGIKQLVLSLGNYQVIDDVSSGEALLKCIRGNRPDIILLDVSLPGRSGLEVLKSIKALYPEIKILILSMYPEEQYAIRMIKAGASGYLHKDSEPKILDEALEKISKGEEYISPSLTRLLFEAMNKNTNELPHQILSDREFEVLIELGNGLSLSEIGVKLNLSVKTISTYRTRILDKMELDNNSELVKYLIAHDLNSSLA